MTVSRPVTTPRNRLIVLSAGAGLVQRVAQLLSAIFTLPLALHHLGVAGFGIWGAATSLVWLTGFLDLGLGSALVTLLPRALAGGDGTQARLHVAASLLGGGLAAMAIMLILAALILAGAAIRLPFLIAGFALALNIPLSIAPNVWFGLQKGYVAAAWDCVQTALTLALLIIAAVTGGGVTALVLAVFLALLTANGGSILCALVTQPAIRPAVWRVDLAALRAVAAPGFLLFGIGIAGASAYAFDNILALDWLGPTAAAQMTVALRVCTTAATFLFVVTQPLWPAFVDAASREDRMWNLRTLWRGTLAVGLLALCGGALLVGFGRPVLTFWLHGNLALPPGLFWAMAAWIFCLGTPRIAALLFNAVGILRFQLAAGAGAALLAFGLKYLGAAHFGVTGMVAAAPVAWLLVIWPAFAWRARRWTRDAL